VKRVIAIHFAEIIWPIDLLEPEACIAAPPAEPFRIEPSGHQLLENFLISAHDLFPSFAAAPARARTAKSAFVYPRANLMIWMHCRQFIFG